MADDMPIIGEGKNQNPEFTQQIILTSQRYREVIHEMMGVVDEISFFHPEDDECPESIMIWLSWLWSNGYPVSFQPKLSMAFIEVPVPGGRTLCNGTGETIALALKSASERMFEKLGLITQEDSLEGKKQEPGSPETDEELPTG